MKSRITIEVDFDNGNLPVIQIISKESDDVRDKLIKSFYENLGESSWCKISFNENWISSGHPDNFKRVVISPISHTELKTEAKIMLDQYNITEKFKNS